MEGVLLLIGNVQILTLTPKESGVNVSYVYKGLPIFLEHQNSLILQLNSCYLGPIWPCFTNAFYVNIKIIQCANSCKAISAGAIVKSFVVILGF